MTQIRILFIIFHPGKFLLRNYSGKFSGIPEMQCDVFTCTTGKYLYVPRNYEHLFPLERHIYVLMEIWILFNPFNLRRIAICIGALVPEFYFSFFAPNNQSYTSHKNMMVEWNFYNKIPASGCCPQNQNLVKRLDYLFETWKQKCDELMVKYLIHSLTKITMKSVKTM